MNTRTAFLLAAAWVCLFSGSLVVCAGEQPSLSDLLSNLKSSDEAVQVQAIDELADLGPKAVEAVDPLTKLLKSESAKLRAHAVRALGEIGAAAKPAVPTIVGLLKDSDEAVRRQAINALMDIRPGPQVTVPLCTKLLEDADPGMRVRILHAISDTGPHAVPWLTEALKNEKAAFWACLIIRDMGPAAKDALPALVERLQKSPNPDVRREVLLALAAMEEAASPATSQIAKAIGDEHTRAAATYALGRIGRIPAGTDVVIRSNTTSDDKLLAITSLWAMARVHPEDQQLRREVTEQLIGRLKDADPFVRAAAARSLAALPPAPEITGPIWEKALQDADETTVHYALDALASLGAPAVPRLIAGLKHGKLRAQIADVLGRIGAPAASATPELAKLVSDKDEHVAREAILALAAIGPGAKEAVPSLLKALEQTGHENAAPIAYALGKIGPEAAQAEEALTALLTGSDPHVALASAWALVRIQPATPELTAKTLPVLLAGLSSEAPIARQAAAEALGSLGPLAKEALPALKKAASDEDPAVRQAATEALEQVGKKPEK